MIDVVIIGEGAVAEALAREMEGANGLRLVQVWTRRTPTLHRADLYIIAVTDGAIGEVSSRLNFPPDSVVAHTAGGVDVKELSSSIVHRAVIYPLQSFTKGIPIEDFRSRVPFFVEGTTSHARETVLAAAEAIAGSVTEMTSEKRAKLHLAATFAANFANAMWIAAEALAADAEVPFDSLRPLIAGVGAKALRMPSPRAAQTGPAARGDRKTQARHLEILREKHPELTDIYTKISEFIVNNKRS